MLKKIKNLKGRLLSFLWNSLPLNFSDVSVRLNKLLDYLKDLIFDIILLLSPIKALFRFFIIDVRLIFIQYWSYIWFLITKHRLLYIFRLIFLIYFLYKPTIIDLDSIYWLWSILFYFVSNSLFFFSSLTIPWLDWSFRSPTIRGLIFLSLLPALWTARRFKRRAYKKRKVLLKDDEVFSTFNWAQQIFVLSFYYIFFFLNFFFFSILIPLIYIYLIELDFVSVISLVYSHFFSSFTFLSFFTVFVIKSNFVIISYLYITYFSFVVYVFFELFAFVYLGYLGNYGLMLIYSCFSYIILFLFSFVKIYFPILFSLLVNLGVLLKFIFNYFGFNFSLSSFYDFIDIFKNFLFSDNYFNFIFIILAGIFKSVFTILFKVGLYILILLKSVGSAILPSIVFESLNSNLVVFKSYILINFYELVIKLLEAFAHYYGLYFSDISFFGLVSTWYEHINSGVQRGISARHSLVNWAFVHLYASIVVFWFLDFDFRASVKTPPRTPHMLLLEAKKTYDWVPDDMDFLALQTYQTQIYFALLDISFEHVESLQFIYGDFEYIDEEFDREDETPDEEEYWVESEETSKVREIIESDVGFTRRPNKMADGDPLNSKTSLERHYIREIVGEPELIYIQEPLKWMYSSLYSPSFEDLHFRDSLFSDWIFDPDEDLTFFEFLVLFPLLFFFVYVWVLHRRTGIKKHRSHYRQYLRLFIPVRHTMFSGWWAENILGLPLGERMRFLLDKWRHYRSPDMRFRSVYRFKIYRHRQKFKLMHLEAYYFEKLRMRLYRDSLTQWEFLTGKSAPFFVEHRTRPYFRAAFKQYYRETKDWVRAGDWAKYFHQADIPQERVMYHFEDLQISLPRLIEKYINRPSSKRKLRRGIWRTITHIPGHLSMPFRAKGWYSRYINTFFYYPATKVRYNYNYYNYVGWRQNRAEWRRYAFTPGSTSDKIVDYDRYLQRKAYRFFRRLQRRRRLMRAFQF